MRKSPAKAAADHAGGVRPLARALGLHPSVVSGWIRAERIPAHHQLKVLQKSDELGWGLSCETLIRGEEIAEELEAV